VLATEVRPTLERLVATGPWYDAEWASAALQRLP
jgi:hypothetical protein